MKQHHTITLQRERTSAHGTEGILHLPNGQTFFTLELPWRDNAANMSCIPTGSYKAVLRKSPRFGLTYHLKDVPNRSYILMHSGNYAGDTTKGLRTNVQGCILLGTKRGTIAGQRAVLSSKVAIRKFMKVMGGKPFSIEVR